MELKKLYTVAVALPKPGHYLCLSRYEKKKNCLWNAADMARFTALQERMRRIYSSEAPTDEPSYYVPGIDPEQAVARLLPVYLTVSFSGSRPPLIVNAKDNVLDVEEPAGVEGQHGLILTLISKEPGKLAATEELLEALGIPEFLDDLDFRSDREVLAAVAACEKPFKGKFKVVTIPAQLSGRLRLTANSRGEYVTEVPEVWA